MVKEALEYLVKLGMREPYRETIHGLEYSDHDLTVITPPRAASLGFERLQGFADYVLHSRDELPRSKLIVWIGSPREVYLKSALDVNYRDRETFSVATMARQYFAFGRWMPIEDFTISVQTQFAASEDRGRLLEIAGNVSADEITTSADDGVSQTVSVKAGLMLLERKKIANPFDLAPYRTFAEVSQPSSPFILRARKNGGSAELALFECDNGAWQIMAVANIKAWLAKHIKEIPILG